jgi:hypothetical protein
MHTPALGVGPAWELSSGAWATPSPQLQVLIPAEVGDTAWPIPRGPAPHLAIPAPAARRQNPQGAWMAVLSAVGFSFFPPCGEGANARGECVLCPRSHSQRKVTQPVEMSQFLHPLSFVCLLACCHLCPPPPGCPGTLRLEDLALLPHLAGVSNLGSSGLTIQSHCHQPDLGAPAGDVVTC